jgi:hypothetical protein
MVLAGFLPFSAIYVELYYVFASVWGHKVWCARARHAHVQGMRDRSWPAD